MASTRRRHFDRIRRVDDAAHTLGIGEERHDVLPVASLGLSDRRSPTPVARPQILRSLHAGFGVRGPVNGAERRHDGFATSGTRTQADGGSGARCWLALGEVAPIPSRLARQFASLPSYQHLANLVAFLFRL